MKKQKLSLEELKVNSFVVNMEGNKQTVVGGSISSINIPDLTSLQGLTVRCAMK